MGEGLGEGERCNHRGCNVLRNGAVHLWILACAGMTGRDCPTVRQRTSAPVPNSCSSCFIRSRSGIANSSNDNPAPARDADPYVDIIPIWQFNGCQHHKTRRAIESRPLFHRCWTASQARPLARGLDPRVVAFAVIANAAEQSLRCLRHLTRKWGLGCGNLLSLRGAERRSNLDRLSETRIRRRHLIFSQRVPEGRTEPPRPFLNPPRSSFDRARRARREVGGTFGTRQEGGITARCHDRCRYQGPARLGRRPRELGPNPDVCWVRI
jgi:hypothetical protein